MKLQKLNEYDNPDFKYENIYLKNKKLP